MSAAERTLEIVWQQDPTAYVFARGADGTLAADGLNIGTPASADLTLARGIDARRVGVQDLVALAADPPAGLEPGGSARAVFAIVELAHRSVAEGLVHPYLDHGDGGWHAFWGATLDETVQASLAEIAAALPPVAADAFDGDRDTMVHDLYPVVVDQIARDRLRADRVSLVGRLPRRPLALELFIEGLAGPESLLPPHSGYAALEAAAVAVGLRRPRRARARLGGRVEAQPAPRRAHGRGRDGARARAVAAGRGRPVAQPPRVARVGRRRTASSRSYAPAIRVATSSAGWPRSSRCSPSTASSSTATRRPRHHSTSTLRASSCATRCRSSRNSACRCYCRASGCARRGCA